MLILHDAMGHVLKRLKGEGHGIFEIYLRGNGEWQCFPVKISYWPSISKGKDMSPVKHRMPV